MRYLCFQDTLTRPSIERLLSSLRGANGPKGLYVDSPGGEFEHFSVLGPAIERQHIVTLAGNVRSAAIILFLLGHQRYAQPDSTFFFHQVHTLVKGTTVNLCDLEETAEYEQWLSAYRREHLQEWRRQMRMAQTWFVNFIAEKTGLSPGVFQNLMRAEATLSVREAMRYGIVHRVQEERPTFV